MAKNDTMILSDLEFAVEKGEIDTVMVAFTDMQGRLQGKRASVGYFLTEVLATGMTVPAHLLTVDSGMRPAPGYAPISDAAGTGTGNMVMHPDVRTLFRMPWQEGAVGVLCDVNVPDGDAIAVSPRTILTRALKPLEASNITAVIGSEHDFVIFEESYEEAFARGYAGLTPLTRLHASHSAFASARAELLLSRIRRSLVAVPVAIEGTVAGAAPGQYELTLRHQEALRSCDEGVISKNAVKEMVAQAGRSSTFMAKYDLTDTGNAAHTSLSFRGGRGGMALTDRYDETGLSPAGRSFVASHLAHARELMILFAPTPNSYRRFGSEGFAPSAANWGRDDRTCAFRTVSADAILRLENRIPGSDANPYLVAAGMVAAGLDGLQNQRPLEVKSGVIDRAELPASLEEACAAWEESEWVGATFGTDVQSHYANMARVEIAAAEDGREDPIAWERARYFEMS